MSSRRSVVILLMLAGLALSAGVALAAGDSGAFVMLAGRDTIALERFERTGDLLEGTLVYVPAQVRFDYTLMLEPDGTVRRMEDEVRPATALLSTSPTQSAVLEWRADSVIADVQSRGMQRIASQAGSIPFLNPSLLMLELVVKRAVGVSPPRGSVPVFAVNGGRTMDCTLRFASNDSLVLALGAVEFGLRIDARGHIVSGSVPAQGLRFERLDSLPKDRLSLRPIDYSPPPGAPYRAEPVRVPTRGGFELAGTLTRPVPAAGKGSVAKLPCVITITGSGPQDRDERIAIVRGYRLFGQIADTLSRRGIAVLRLDDRGTGGSGGRFAGSTTADFANDVEDALRWLRREPGIDTTRLALLGHSEGGLIAPMVAARERSLAAIVLLAGPAWDGRRVLVYQNEQLLKKKLAGAALDSAMAAARKNIDSLGVADPWMAWFIGHDPLPVARQLAKPPVLLLQGETDRQVSAEQVDELAAAFKAAGNRDVTVHRLPATNHLFLRDPSGDPAGYAMLPSGQVPRATLGLIADWLAARLAPAAGAVRPGAPSRGSASRSPRP